MSFMDRPSFSGAKAGGWRKNLPLMKSSPWLLCFGSFYYLYLYLYLPLYSIASIPLCFVSWTGWTMVGVGDHAGAWQSGCRWRNGSSLCCCSSQVRYTSLDPARLSVPRDIGFTHSPSFPCCADSFGMMLVSMCVSPFFTFGWDVWALCMESGLSE